MAKTPLNARYVKRKGMAKREKRAIIRGILTAAATVSIVTGSVLAAKHPELTGIFNGIGIGLFMIVIIWISL
jgi:hypothetical protein